uniref:Uncharacterized protein n=1 Tax=Arundo donax TaxID=35708 RepID=A0A0A9A6N8_ARUDO
MTREEHDGWQDHNNSTPDGYEDNLKRYTGQNVAKVCD